MIGSRGGRSRIEDCLAALEPQRDGVEVLVCESRDSGAELRRRFPWVTFRARAGALVPELWSLGIAEASGEIVALTIAPMVPTDDWIATIRDLHLRYDVVAGAIEPAEGLGVRDLAEYLCRYSPDMLPFEAHECAELPGDNAAYKRVLLERTRDLHRTGFWEPVVHRELAREGAVLWHAPEMVVRQGRSGGTLAFLRQRFVHGRHHGRQRGARFGLLRNVVGVAGAPAVPPLLTVRMMRRVAARDRLHGRALAAVPLVVAFNLAWAGGEAVGHVDAIIAR